MSQQTIFGIEEQIKKHSQELADLKLKLEEAKKESPDHQLAKELHSIKCRWNHTDGCGWYYEMKNKQDDWTGSSHGEYLKKAQRLIHECEQQGVPVDTAIALFKLVEAV